jgi:hypothetical protein
MYNLISFPHYTCGGLLCDILNNSWSDVGPRGDIKSMHHSLGKIGDTDTVLVDYDTQDLITKLNKLSMPDNTWIGTHCWPSEELIDQVKQVIVITTSTSRSQIYRWTRTYHHYFEPQWTKLHGMEKIDKMRETAKNYIVPFLPVQNPNVVNLEFADVVDNTNEFRHVINYQNVDSHLTRWQKINSFLYSQNFWNSPAVTSFYQAEHEVRLDRYYRYD